MQYLPSEINGSNSVKESAFNLVVWRKIQSDSNRSVFTTL